MAILPAFLIVGFFVWLYADYVQTEVTPDAEDRDIRARIYDPTEDIWN